MRVNQTATGESIELSEDETAGLMSALRTFLELLRSTDRDGELWACADRGFAAARNVLGRLQPDPLVAQDIERATTERDELASQEAGKP